MFRREPFYLFAAVVSPGLVLVGPRLLLSAADPLAFAGLNLQTTIEVVQKRYPHSHLVGHHVYVDDADSHDHIYGIDVPRRSDPSPQLRIFFERTGRTRHDYPLCELVARKLRNQYGAPVTVQDTQEEQSRNRRLIWRRGEEELALVCFQIRRQPLVASELILTAIPLPQR